MSTNLPCPMCGTGFAVEDGWRTRCSDCDYSIDSDHDWDYYSFRTLISRVRTLVNVVQDLKQRIETLEDGPK